MLAAPSFSYIAAAIEANTVGNGRGVRAVGVTEVQVTMSLCCVRVGKVPSAATSYPGR